VDIYNKGIERPGILMRSLPEDLFEVQEKLWSKVETEDDEPGGALEDDEQGEGGGNMCEGPDRSSSEAGVTSEQLVGHQGDEDGFGGPQSLWADLLAEEVTPEPQGHGLQPGSSEDGEGAAGQLQLGHGQLQTSEEQLQPVKLQPALENQPQPLEPRGPSPSQHQQGPCPTQQGDEQELYQVKVVSRITPYSTVMLLTCLSRVQ